MLSLDPSACKAIAVSGSGVIEAYANIQSNSNGADCAPGDPVGFSRTGGATIDVFAPDATCRVVGEFQDQGSGPPITCTVAENSFALPDPLRNLPAPAKPASRAGDDAGGPHGRLRRRLLPGRLVRRRRSETANRACDVGGNGPAVQGPCMDPASGSLSGRPEGRQRGDRHTSCPGSTGSAAAASMSGAMHRSSRSRPRLTPCQRRRRAVRHGYDPGDPVRRGAVLQLEASALRPPVPSSSTRVGPR